MQAAFVKYPPTGSVGAGVKEIGWRRLEIEIETFVGVVASNFLSETFGVPKEKGRLTSANTAHADLCRRHGIRWSSRG